MSGSARTPWTADSTSPVIHLRWQGRRQIGSLIVRPAAGLPSTPLTVKITSPDGTREASIGAGGLVRFATPLTTDRIDVSFPRVRQATIVTDGPAGDAPGPAVAALGAGPGGPACGHAIRIVSLACGQGPALTTGGCTRRRSAARSVS